MPFLGGDSHTMHVNGSLSPTRYSLDFSDAEEELYDEKVISGIQYHLGYRDNYRESPPHL